MARLTVDEPRGVSVWRVGYRPQPWAWVGWEWATNGRFSGRWDDRDGNFRTLYVGSTLLACLVEVLANFRPDPHMALDEITEEEEDRANHPTTRAGVVDVAWLNPRAVGTGRLVGRYCAITTSESIAFLHSSFVALAKQLGLKDFDAAALKDGRARPLTQAVAANLYAVPDLDGVRFSSRHGDDLVLWSIFERPDDGDITSFVTDRDQHELNRDHPAMHEAFKLLGLCWSDQSELVAGNEEPDPPTPLPLVHADEQTAVTAVFGNSGPSPATPVGAATLWWLALEDPAKYRTALSRLCADTEAWGDFAEAQSVLSGLSISQHAIQSDERPGELAYVKFIDVGDLTAQAFEATSLSDVWILTMVKIVDGWRVWGLSHNLPPSAAEVFPA